ncbi:phosphoethanolamine transferase [Vibrio metoecus]|uniref:Phosphoethanolamine transferase n=1 Tax=Vibrio metoecus TaxID=1481663 RepID=A0A271VNR0_VIBMT|nr:phosphoethanolamine--lipid A transferase [Vibrio metoecus]KQB09915.1 hydrolase [Vibrio metoecus]PAR19694.1 phosphoethanolamine transferase [Vibrio metoecus]PAR24726.1 phosphoethanolamine transferase [Vibrio metoecus]PAR29774.1 phosphoethanolamine transferase [Vibrio metoecus]PAR31434.1 phosphoethanolamine transferase [Vibrio metoecus]
MRTLNLKTFSYNQLVLILAIYFALPLNLPVYEKLAQIFTESAQIHWGFVISIPLFFLFALNFIFQIFSWPYLFKPFFALLLIISSILSFVGFQYGTIVDRDMLVNVLETNSSEASSYLTVYSVLWFVVLGVLPALWLLLTPIRKEKSVWRFLGKKSLSMLVSLLAVALIAALYYQNYSSVGRNNSYLKRMIIPTHFIYSSVGLVKQRYFTEPMVYKMIGTDAQQKTIATDSPDQKPTLVFFVLGETARVQNYQYFGYPRDTNAYTQPFQPIFFKNVASCGTATAISVPCMFSNMTRDNFDRNRADNQDNVLDILQRAGISLLWKENDGGDKGVAKNIPLKELARDKREGVCDGDTCYDIAMLENLDQEIADQNGNRMIFMHIIGSHGPTYFKRYPKEMAVYQPDCPRADIENCSVEQIVNTYDNTIRYTDYVLAQLMTKLESLQKDYNTALIYISDHGESLGENGMFLHGMPYNLAPDYQTQVPLLVWMSQGFSQSKGIDVDCLRSKTNLPYSHGNLFHSLLGVMDVSTEAYETSLDLFSQCRANAAPSN